MKYMIFVLILLLILINGCEKEKTESDNSSFSFKVIVLDEDGNPVPDLQIGVYNKIPLGFPENNNRSQTSVSFDVKENEIATLTITNLEDEILELLDCGPGVHTHTWEPEIEDRFGGTNVYKVTLESATCSASQFAVEHNFPLDLNQIGLTNSNGIFETNDKRYFPNFYYEGMDFDFIDEDGNLLGTYQFTNTIVLNLPDREYEREIVSGQNEFTLIFDGAK